jgi:hypothetical protein
MPRYKLQFLNATWQGKDGRQFISLTRINDDGSSQILHLVDSQISFGNYASDVKEKRLEFYLDQTKLLQDDIGEKIASEDLYCHLLGEDVLGVMLRDKNFLDYQERKARLDNHQHRIDAVLELKKGRCPEWVTTADSYRFNYRQSIMASYFKYLLGCDHVRVNAHPAGLFTVIHADVIGGTVNPGVNALGITEADADEMRSLMKQLITYQGGWRFMGQPVPCETKSTGLPAYHLEITNPTPEQTLAVQMLFDRAMRKGFFPSDPKDMIRKAWAANCAKISFSAPTSSWSPALLPAPGRKPESRDQQFDVRYHVGPQ